MNSHDLEHFPRENYPAIELDMIDFMKHLSDEYICGKVDVKDDSVQINLNTINCRTKDCTDLGEISSNSISRVEQGEGVRKFDIKFISFYYETARLTQFYVRIEVNDCI